MWDSIKTFFLHGPSHCYIFLMLLVYCRNASDSNEQHDSEICSAREAAEQDAGKSTQDMLRHLDSEYCQFLYVFEFSQDP